MVAGESHRDGVLLERIMWWIKYSSVFIPKKTGKWIANKHEFWKKEARLSPDQLTRSLNRLESKGLTSRQRFKYRNMMRWWFPLAYFLFAYIIKLGFLDGKHGFHYAFYKAWYFLSIRLMASEGRSSQVGSAEPQPTPSVMTRFQ